MDKFTLRIEKILLLYAAVIEAYTLVLPNMSERINRARKTKKMILAIEAAPAATPPNPKKAAIKAITKNVMDQLSIRSSPLVKCG